MKKEHMTKKAVRRVLREYWAQYTKYPVLALASFLLPGLGSIFVFLIPPLVISKIVNMIAAGTPISISSLGGSIALFGGLWLLGEFLWRTGMYTLTQLETKAMKNISNLTFGLLLERDYNFYANNFVGSLTKKAQALSRNFEIFTDTFSFNVTPTVLPMIFALIVLSRYSPIISLVLVISLVLLVIFIVPRIRKRAALVAERHETGSRLVGGLSDVVTNMIAVKSFAKEDIEHKHLNGLAEKFTNAFNKAALYHVFGIDTIISPIYVITNMLGLTAAIYFTYTLGLPAGALVVIFSYYATVTRSFWTVNQVYRQIESTISESTEFIDLVIEKPEVLDVPNAQSLSVTEGAVSFNTVDFAYGEEAFLKDFSLSISPKQKIGLVGPSGGGKTTITKLLMRFMDIQSGSIQIDGQDISKVTQKSLRTQISYVPQEPLLFHRSLFENIAYGNDEATREEVITAAKLAHAHEFISTLPDGYETLVGERGIKLSGGQRQRIAIARALLKKASILVLDEATSALDSESEKYIQESLKDLMQDKTALVIAHRLSTIKHLDRIIVLDNGTIVQDGTHDELIKAKKGLYAKLWSHQSGGFIED